MKRVIIAAMFIAASFSGFSQSKTTASKDTASKTQMDSAIVVSFKPIEFNALTTELQKLIDSKIATAQILNFLYDRSRLVTQPAAKKPKE